MFDELAYFIDIALTIGVLHYVISLTIRVLHSEILLNDHALHRPRAADLWDIFGKVLEVGERVVWAPA